MQQDKPWNITAKSMTFSDKEKIYEAEGDVVITSGDQVLYAQKAVYRLKSGIAEVSGDVRLVSGGDIFTGDSGTFNLNKKTGKITNGKLFLKDNNFYIKGAHMEKLDENTYLVKQCHVTTCDGDRPAWSIVGSEIKVTIEGYGAVKNARFQIRDIPVLYFPYLIFPAKTKRQTGLLPPTFGHSSRNGLEFELPFFWAISDQTDATFYQRHMSSRGYMQGLEFRYVVDENSKGDFMFDILSDKQDKDLNDPDDVEISPFSRTNQTRYWLRGKTDQKIFDGLVARLDADYVSDQDYMNEFNAWESGYISRTDPADEFGRPFEEKRSPMRTSALRISHNADEYSIQALSTYHQLPGNPLKDQTAQPLGGVGFSLLPNGICNAPIFFDLNSDYDYVMRDVGQKGHRFSLTPRLRSLFRLSRYMEFEPFIQYSMTPQRFGFSHKDENEQTLNSYEMGANVFTNLDRVFDVAFLNATKLKHRIRPVVSYTYRDYQDEDKQSPWFEPIAEAGDANLVTLSLENFLDARVENKEGAVSYRQWCKFALRQSYNVDENRRDSIPGQDREPFEPLQVEMILHPLANLDFYSEAKWDHYNQEMTFVDLALDLTIHRKGDMKDRFSVDYIYDREGISQGESINLWFDVNLIHGLSAGGSFEKDMDFSRNISNRYWFQYQRQCWGLKLVAEDEDEETRIMLIFQLIGLGDVSLN